MVWSAGVRWTLKDYWTAQQRIWSLTISVSTIIFCFNYNTIPASALNREEQRLVYFSMGLNVSNPVNPVNLEVNPVDVGVNITLIDNFIFILHDM